MKTQRPLLVFAVMLLTVACSTASPRPVRSEFEDVPVPTGLPYPPGESTVIESSSVKAARLVYRGRLEPDSLGVAMRSTLEANGWRNVSSTTTAPDGITQVYEKAGNSLELHIWEGFLQWYTYVELKTSRPIQAAR